MSDFTTRTLAFIRNAVSRLSPPSDDGERSECNIQQCRRCSLLLDFSVSSDMQSLHLHRLPRPPFFTHPVVSLSLFFDARLCLLASPLHQLLRILISTHLLLLLSSSPRLLRHCISRFSFRGWWRRLSRTVLLFTRLPWECVQQIRNYCKLLPQRERGFPAHKFRIHGGHGPAIEFLLAINAPPRMKGAGSDRPDRPTDRSARGWFGRA